jgi:hypothetical protein
MWTETLGLAADFCDDASLSRIYMGFLRAWEVDRVQLMRGYAYPSVGTMWRYSLAWAAAWASIAETGSP